MMTGAGNILKKHVAEQSQENCQRPGSMRGRGRAGRVCRGSPLNRLFTSAWRLRRSVAGCCQEWRDMTNTIYRLQDGGRLGQRRRRSLEFTEALWCSSPAYSGSRRRPRSPSWTDDHAGIFTFGRLVSRERASGVMEVRC
ncbi:hypothetical protein DPEC_G00366110 [Dallia pectoralis]|nr:hypothetical protein DPEC_G00366110 [Dallia pectoralis]